MAALDNEDKQALERLGWSDFWRDEDTEHVGRVIEETGTWFDVQGAFGCVRTTTGGAVRRENRPATGDWVRLDATHERIECVLERRTTLVRQAAGEVTRYQVLAANVDVVFIVTSMNQEFNESRLERYLSVVYEAGASPVILLNKSDMAEDPQSFHDRANAIALGIPVVSMSALTGEGLDPILDQLGPGRTCAFVGSSGVGKSTIINALAGQAIQAVKQVFEDNNEGRHTTTNRKLIELADGRGLLIDTPGIRELQLWDAIDGVSETFAEIEEVAELCKFRDCKHVAEPGCAVQAALSEGTLNQRRFENYTKLQNELLFHDKKRDVATIRAESRRMGKIYRQATNNKKKNR